MKQISQNILMCILHISIIYLLVILCVLFIVIYVYLCMIFVNCLQYTLMCAVCVLMCIVCCIPNCGDTRDEHRHPDLVVHGGADGVVRPVGFMDPSPVVCSIDKYWVWSEKYWV